MITSNKGIYFVVLNNLNTTNNFTDSHIIKKPHKMWLYKNKHNASMLFKCLLIIHARVHLQRQHLTKQHY
jgi:hypothetical protein